jgi:hypothetical protein
MMEEYDRDVVVLDIKQATKKLPWGAAYDAKNETKSVYRQQPIPASPNRCFWVTVWIYTILFWGLLAGMTLCFYYDKVFGGIILAIIFVFTAMFSFVWAGEANRSMQHANIWTDVKHLLIPKIQTQYKWDFSRSSNANRYDFNHLNTVEIPVVHRYDQTESITTPIIAAICETSAYFMHIKITHQIGVANEETHLLLQSQLNKTLAEIANVIIAGSHIRVTTNIPPKEAGVMLQLRPYPRVWNSTILFHLINLFGFGWWHDYVLQRHHIKGSFTYVHTIDASPQNEKTTLAGLPPQNALPSQNENALHAQNVQNANAPLLSALAAVHE